MKINISNEQFKRLIKENSFGEESRSMSAKEKAIFHNAGQDFAKDVYKDEFGKTDPPSEDGKRMAYGYLNHNDFNLPDYKKDADIKSGIFSVGNAKLSPDTLIINFTSAFGCPSRYNCPIGQVACYAVAGENHLKDTRSKNLKVHNLVRLAQSQGKLQQVFNIAKLYIDTYKNSSKPIKWVCFNEAGDFPNQEVLDYATQFAKEIEQEYGVKCMAYTAKPLDYREASKYIAINASTKAVLRKLDPSAPKRNFFGITHNHFDYDFLRDKADAEYEEWKIKNNLKKSDKAETVEENIIDKLEINGTAEDITVPILQYGKWGDTEEEQGYYYICPCSFWKDKKDQIEIPYCQNILDRPPYDIKHLRQIYPKVMAKNGKKYDQPIVRKLTQQLNKIKSPCGVTCAVCHDRKGGIVKGTNEHVKDYAILTAIHGSTMGNFNPEYAREKRMGNHTIRYSKDNPYGLWERPGLENRGDKKG